MLGNEVAGEAHSFCEPDSFSQNFQSQVRSGNWPVLNNNRWVGIQEQNGVPAYFDTKNYIAQSSEFEQRDGRRSSQMPFGTNLTQSSLKSEITRGQSLNGSMHGYHNIQVESYQANFLGDDTVSDGHSLTPRNLLTFESQQHNAPEFSSGSKISSEGSELAETPTTLDFLAHQQLMMSQYPGISHHSRQQQGFNDMQLWQQNLMYKQLQEMQRQQQLQQLDQGGRQQNLQSQLSCIARQAAINQLPAVLSGTPVNDASKKLCSNEYAGSDLKTPSNNHMLFTGNLNWAQRSGSPMHGISNGSMFSHDQSQLMWPLGAVPQQFDQSLYGTPVSNFGNSASHYPQGVSHDCTNVMNKAGGDHVEKSSMQAAAFNFFQSDQYVAPEQSSLQDSVSVARQEFQEKVFSGMASAQGLNTNAISGDHQQANYFSKTSQVQDFQDKKERTDWSGNLQEKAVTQLRPSRGVANLDPTEEKLLFGTADDGNWAASFGNSSYPKNAGFGNSLESTEFPSIQSGSWSALMQEAVEASSSETGLHEEWSGLSFQKTELSSGNHSAVMHDNGKQMPWNDSNVQSECSMTSRSFPLFNDADGSASCRTDPDFQQSIRFTCEKDEGLPTDASHGSMQQVSEGGDSKQLDQSQQHIQFLGASLHSQTQSDYVSNGVWVGQMYAQSFDRAHSTNVGLNSQSAQGVLAHQQKMPLCDVNSRPTNEPNSYDINGSLASSIGNKLKSTDQNSQRNNISGTMHIEKSHESHKWEAGTNQEAISFPSFIGELNPARSDINRPEKRNDAACFGNLSAVRTSNTLKGNQEMSQQVLNEHRVDHVHNHLNRTSHAWHSTLKDTNKGSGETYDNHQESGHTKEVSHEGFISDRSLPSQYHIGGVGENTSSAANGPYRPATGNQNAAGQSKREALGPYRFRFHPMGSLEMNVKTDSQNARVYSQGQFHREVQGLKGREQPGYGIPNNCLNVAKLIDSQRNANGSEGIQYGAAIPGRDSAMSSFDGSTFSQNRNIDETSQNMLDLLHKVDQSRDSNTASCFNFSDHSTSEIHRSAASDVFARLQHIQSSPLEGFGMEFAPPSRWQPLSSYSLPSHASLQTVDDSDSKHLNAGTLDKDHMVSPSPTNTFYPSPAHGTSQIESCYDKSSLPGQASKDRSYSDIYGQESAASSLPYASSQSVMQQHNSSATGLAAMDQSAKLSFGSQSDVDAHTKHVSHPKLTNEPHDGMVVDPSTQASMPSTDSRLRTFKLTLPADTRVPVASQFSSVDLRYSQLSNANTHLRSAGQGLTVVETKSVNLPPATANVSQQVGFPTMLHNVWTNVSSRQHLSGAHPQMVVPNLHQSISSLACSRDTNSSAPQVTFDENQKGGSTPAEFHACANSSQEFTYEGEYPVKANGLQQIPSDKGDFAPTKSTSGGQQPMSRHLPDRNYNVSVPSFVRLYQQDPDRGKNAHDSNGGASLKMGSSGRTLKSPDSLMQNYSLLQQMQAMKEGDSDLKKRVGKRHKGSDFGNDDSPLEWTAGQGFTYGQSTIFEELDATSERSFLPSDVKMLSFSSSEIEEENTDRSSLLIGRDMLSQDILTSRPYDSQNQADSHSRSTKSTFPGGSERPHVSPQMAPSWFAQYGDYKNGQILAMYDGLSNSQRSAKAAGQHCLFRKVPESMHSNTVVEQRGDASQIGLQHNASSSAMAAIECSPRQPPDVIDNNMQLIPKKRKSATSGLLPWHKEVTQIPRRLHNFSMAELHWAQAANRLFEKVGDEFEMMGDGPSITRPRKRLILTTNLMQQLLPSVPAKLLAADATTSYESVMYLVAKLVLRDACSLISCSGSIHARLTSGNMISEELETSEKVGDHYFSEVAENFIGRARKLEGDLLRLDKRSSVLDLRLECQELERCSIVNRFAKFHGKTQTERVQSSLTSETAPGWVYPQKHVTALAMPGNYPEGALCMSL